MTPIGSPTQWSEVVRPQVEPILRLITRTWDAMPAPPRSELEKPMALRLAASMQNAPDRDDFLFRVVPEYMLLDALGNETGRIDIAFMQFVCHDSVYFGVECKRLNSLNGSGLRWYHTNYVNEGIARFTTSKYAEVVDTGGMVGFVLNGDTNEAIAKVGEFIGQKKQELGISSNDNLRQSSVCADDQRIRETHHSRGDEQRGFLLHHVFLAGDPSAPLRTDDEKPKPKKNATKRQPRKKPAS